MLKGDFADMCADTKARNPIGDSKISKSVHFNLLISHYIHYIHFILYISVSSMHIFIVVFHSFHFALCIQYIRSLIHSCIWFFPWSGNLEGDPQMPPNLLYQLTHLNTINQDISIIALFAFICLSCIESSLLFLNVCIHQRLACKWGRHK